MNAYTIKFYNDEVFEDISKLPKTLRARCLHYFDVMIDNGPNLGLPHTKVMGNGLFELRLRGKEGIARVFYCTIINRQIILLHSFIKKTNKTPSKELDIANKRMKETKNA